MLLAMHVIMLHDRAFVFDYNPDMNMTETVQEITGYCLIAS